jgi:hypothetical protein
VDCIPFIILDVSVDGPRNKLVTASNTLSIPDRLFYFQIKKRKIRSKISIRQRDSKISNTLSIVK